jgi:hypothetical protein
VDQGRRAAIKESLPAIVGAILGALPFLLANALHGFPSLTQNWASRPASDLADAYDNALWLLRTPVRSAAGRTLYRPALRRGSALCGIGIEALWRRSRWIACTAAIDFDSGGRIAGVPSSPWLDYLDDAGRLPDSGLRWAIVGRSRANLDVLARRAKSSGTVAASAVCMPLRGPDGREREPRRDAERPHVRVLMGWNCTRLSTRVDTRFLRR